MSGKKQVFIVGLDPDNKERLESLPHGKECEFHPALTYDEIRDGETFEIEDLIRCATERMEAHWRVDAVASYWDFPGSTLAAVLAERFGLPGPSLEAVLKCEHKYWSRLEQRKVIPDNIPRFRPFDPWDDEAYERLDLLPPFWIKPIKSFRSFLASQITGPRHFEEVVSLCREKGDSMTAPFLYLMRTYGMPPEISEMRETFIAESALGGFLCTLEGYSAEGRVAIYGIVDSVPEPDSSSFARYEYPSCLPLEIQHRMMDVARLAIEQIGYDQGPFNVEFFYDQTGGRVWLLEINPRISESHADLFEKVHGCSHQGIMLDLALGRMPRPLERKGAYTIAAKFMLRTFEQGKVTRVPSPAAIRKLGQRQPGTIVKSLVRPGQQLSDLARQDMYSYEIANVFIGGRDQSDLFDKYDEALAVLQFDIEKEPEKVPLCGKPLRENAP